jgi:hypothetical protein
MCQVREKGASVIGERHDRQAGRVAMWNNKISDDRLGSVTKLAARRCLFASSDRLSYTVRLNEAQLRDAYESR